MFGKPTTVTYSKINIIAEAVKQAETATELSFKTSYKLARLSSHLEEFTKMYKKVKATIVKTFQESTQGKADVSKLHADSDEIENMEETILMPEFLMSEFISGEGDKKKYLVSQSFLNKMVNFIEDDTFKLPEAKVSVKPSLEERFGKRKEEVFDGMAKAAEIVETV